MKLRISQVGTFKGVVKNGIDSGTLIDLIVRFGSAPDFFEARGFGFPNMFYCHRISRREVVGVLLNSYDFAEKEDAIAALNGLTDKFNISVIDRKASDVNFENAVRDANEAAMGRNRGVDQIGNEDVIIIGGFLRENINTIHSTDYHFRKTCKGLGMNVFNPTREN